MVPVLTELIYGKRHKQTNIQINEEFGDVMRCATMKKERVVSKRIISEVMT